MKVKLVWGDKNPGRHGELAHGNFELDIPDEPAYDLINTLYNAGTMIFIHNDTLEALPIEIRKIVFGEFFQIWEEEHGRYTS